MSDIYFVSHLYHVSVLSFLRDDFNDDFSSSVSSFNLLGLLQWPSQDSVIEL